MVNVSKIETGIENNKNNFINRLLKKNKNKIIGNKNIIVLNILSRLVKKLKNKPIKLNANAPNIPNSNIL